ncbi:MAG TPA: heme-binding protein [Rickettsiales bacterium]|nr:heme-binding protein [Rickettsiales bacterium]
MRTKPSLTNSDTQKIMTACKAEAQKNNWKVSIAIVDEAGYLLQFERMDGASLTSADIAMGKARTAALAKVATRMLEDSVKERPAMISFPGRVPVQGGVPLLYEGECVGGIGVSGVKSPEDEQVALAGSKTLAA